jgi:hypothetical protein
LERQLIRQKRKTASCPKRAIKLKVIELDSHTTGSSGTGILLRNTTFASTRCNKGRAEIPYSPI